MAKEIDVVTDAVLEEARKWDLLPPELQKMKAAIDHFSLTAAAFFVLYDPLFVRYAWLYEAFRQNLMRSIAGAIEESTQVGAALRKIAAEYDTADHVSSAELYTIFDPGRDASHD